MAIMIQPYGRTTSLKLAAHSWKVSWFFSAALTQIGSCLQPPADEQRNFYPPVTHAAQRSSGWKCHHKFHGSPLSHHWFETYIFLCRENYPTTVSDTHGPSRPPTRQTFIGQESIGGTWQCQITAVLGQLQARMGGFTIVVNLDAVAEKKEAGSALSIKGRWWFDIQWPPTCLSSITVKNAGCFTGW